MAERGLLTMIEGCSAMEQTVASIYSMFSQLFPEERAFWDDLVKDELLHHSWLSDPTFIESIDLLPSGDIIPPLDLIENSLRHARSINRHVRSNPITLEEALRTALRLEESMVEAFANELMANVLSLDYKTLSEKILFAERQHIDKIEGLMIKRGYLQLS